MMSFLALMRPPLLLGVAQSQRGRSQQDAHATRIGSYQTHPLQDTQWIPLLNQRASVAAIRFGVWGQHHRGGYAVAGLQVQEADALGVAAGFADRRRVHADDFAVVADK